MYVRWHTASATAWLGQVEADILASANQALGQGAAYAAQHARGTTKFKDGEKPRLRPSIGREQREIWRFVVAARAKHARFVESGTAAHVIRARRAKALRFVSGGRVVFRHAVKHPGTKPTHFMRDARDAGEQAVFRFVEAGINRAVAR